MLSGLHGPSPAPPSGLPAAAHLGRCRLGFTAWRLEINATLPQPVIAHVQAELIPSPEPIAQAAPVPVLAVSLPPMLTSTFDSNYEGHKDGSVPDVADSDEEGAGPLECGAGEVCFSSATGAHRMDAVHARRPANEPLFRNRLGPGWRHDSLKQAIAIQIKNAGLCGSPYSLRHTAHTQLCRLAKGDLAVVQSITGHRTLSELQKYLHITADRQRIIADAYWCGGHSISPDPALLGGVAQR